MEKRFWVYLLGLLLLGFSLTVLSYLGYVYAPILGMLFLLFIGGFLWVSVPYIRAAGSFIGWDRLLISVLCVVWLLHSIQLFVPETGFDALWYHLPVIEHIIADGKILYIPDLYQTMNPLFADLFFMTGYQTLGIVGAKVIAYVFGILLVFASYVLSRMFLKRSNAIYVVLGVSLLQVVAWQSSSVYVDVAKAFFEAAGVAAVISSIRKNDVKLLFLAALLFSASLATKMFSLLLVPLFVYVFFEAVRSRQQKVITVIFLLGTLLLLALPYYVGAWWYTGNPIFSFVVPLAILGEIGGNSAPLGFILDRLLSAYRVPIQLLLARDYIIHLSLGLVPILAMKVRALLQNPELRILAVFSVFQLGVWWFLPPFSTRYALSGFITLWIVGVYIVETYFLSSARRKQIWYLLVGLQLLVLLLPRVYVAQRSLQFIFSNQTTAHYVQQFYDGNIDPVLDNWYLSNKTHTQGVFLK